MAVPIRYNLKTWREVCTKLPKDDNLKYDIELAISDMGDWAERVLVPIWLSSSERKKVYKIIRGEK